MIENRDVRFAFPTIRRETSFMGPVLLMVDETLFESGASDDVLAGDFGHNERNPSTEWIPSELVKFAGTSGA